MSGTVKPIGPGKTANADAGSFHSAVIRRHGRACFFSGVKTVRELGTERKRPRKPHERCQGKSAVVIHAAHVIPRSQLGPKWRYALPEINGRPACKVCHPLQEAGMLEFPDRVHNAAVRALATFSPRIAGDLLKLLR